MTVLFRLKCFIVIRTTLMSTSTSRRNILRPYRNFTDHHWPLYKPQIEETFRWLSSVDFTVSTNFMFENKRNSYEYQVSLKAAKQIGFAKTVCRAAKPTRDTVEETWKSNKAISEGLERWKWLTIIGNALTIIANGLGTTTTWELMNLNYAIVYTA